MAQGWMIFTNVNLNKNWDITTLRDEGIRTCTGRERRNVLVPEGGVIKELYHWLP